MTKPTTAQLMDRVPISKTYAWGILNGQHTPSRSLAIYIYRKVDWKHEVLDGLSDEQISVLESVDPWVPTAERVA